MHFLQIPEKTDVQSKQKSDWGCNRSKCIKNRKTCIFQGKQGSGLDKSAFD